MTAIGLVVLLTAWLVRTDSFWSGALVNAGTAFLLFAVLARIEPLLVRRIADAQLVPRTLEDAQLHLSGRLGRPARAARTDQAEVRRAVLTMIAGGGLHQDPPGPDGARFRHLSGSPSIEWWVRWDARGITHSVTAHGTEIGRELSDPLGYDAGLVRHENRVFGLLVLLIQAVEPDLG